MPIGRWFPAPPTPPEARGWNINGDAIFALPDGSLQVRAPSTSSCVASYRVVAKDAYIRAKVKKVSGQSLALRLRSSADGYYCAWFNGGNWFGIGKGVQGGFQDLATKRHSQGFDDCFFDFEFRAIGNKLSIYANGQLVVEARDTDFSMGSLGISAYRGTSDFKNVELLIPTGEMLVSDDRDLVTSDDLQADPLAGQPIFDGTKEPQKLPELLKSGQWVALFNGKTLDGWKVAENTPGDGPAGEARAAEGQIELHCSPQQHWTSLVWQGEMPTADYDLYYDVKCTDTDWGTAPVDFPVGQSQLRADANYYRKFSVRGKSFVKGDRNEWFGVGGIPFVLGIWHHVQFRVTEKRVQAWLDGRKVADISLAEGLHSVPLPQAWLDGRKVADMDVNPARLTRGSLDGEYWPLHLGACDSKSLYRNVYLRRISAGRRGHSATVPSAV